MFKENKGRKIWLIIFKIMIILFPYVHLFINIMEGNLEEKFYKNCIPMYEKQNLITKSL